MKNEKNNSNIRSISKLKSFFEGVFGIKKEEESGISLSLQSRIEVLLSLDIANITDEVKYLYRLRSDYVHGNLNKTMKDMHEVGDDQRVYFINPKYSEGKISKTGNGENIFELSDRYMSILRRIIIYYLYLDLTFDKAYKKKYNNVLNLIRQSTVNSKAKSDLDAKLSTIRLMLVPDIQ